MIRNMNNILIRTCTLLLLMMFSMGVNAQVKVNKYKKLPLGKLPLGNIVYLCGHDVTEQTFQYGKLVFVDSVYRLWFPQDN